MSPWYPAVRAAEDETLRELVSALAELSDVDATIVWLSANGYSMAEISERLVARGDSLSEHAIRQRLHRARQRLLGLLSAERASGQ